MAVLSEASVSAIREIVGRYPAARSALLPALHVAQNQVGWVSREAMEEVGSLVGVDPDQVEEVATFYTMFYTEPVGRYVLEVCKTAPCAYTGADEIIEYISTKLGIRPGQTTPDGMFSFFAVECLAACHRAPMMQLNHRYVQDLTPDKVDLIIEDARQNRLKGSDGMAFEIRPSWSESVEVQA